MRNNLEIPQGKRTKLYRFLEILPGLVSYGAIILLFILSLFDPVLGAIYLFILISSTLVKAIAIAFRTIQGYKVIKQAQHVDWHKRLEDLEHPHASFERLRSSNQKTYHFEEHINNLKTMSAMQSEYPKPTDIYHAVIMTAYNEGAEVLDPSIAAVANNTFPNSRIIFVLAYEERGGPSMEQIANSLAAKHNDTF